MAIDQSFLDGLRAQAGLGMGNYTRPSRMRSADQNNTISGNPGYAANTPQQPMTWQQQAQMQQMQAQQLAQDPTNIRYQQQFGAPQGGANTFNSQMLQQQLAAQQGQGQGVGNGSGFGGLFGGMMPQNMQGGRGGQPTQFVQPQMAQPAQQQLLRNRVAPGNMGPSNGRFIRPAMMR